MIASGWNTLITSAAYVGEEMQAEFGCIPPAFLPIGGKYIVQSQLEKFRDRQNIWLSLPNNYEVTVSQQALLDDAYVRIVHGDPSASLGLSVFQVILEIGAERPLEILHGDTLVQNSIPAHLDSVSVGGVTDNYKWGVVESCDGFVVNVRDADAVELSVSGAMILSGYFFIQQPWRFLKCLVAHDFSFTDALDNYAKEVPTALNSSLRTLDCGHLKSYYTSRRQLASARHFNSVSVQKDVVYKRSDDCRKIDAEVHWLRSVPVNIQPYSIRLLEDNETVIKGEYKTLYSSYPTLAELYLARTPKIVWRKVFESCLDYLKEASAHTASGRKDCLEWLAVGKLRKRIAQYPEFLPKPDEELAINGVAIGTLNAIVKKISQVVNEAQSFPCSIMHGDFCFSNILFDIRSERIQLIDPRGLVDGEITIYGDIRYDIAKLGHSILGRYDQILGERIVAQGPSCNVSLFIPPDPARQWLEAEFLKAEVAGLPFNSAEVKATIVSLFLSMIPLHSEDQARQRALFARGLWLFQEFFIPISASNESTN